MNKLDRMIRKERREKYKYYKKIFKARDMASKYLKEPVTVSQVHDYFGVNEISIMYVVTLAKSIVNTGCKRRRPPAQGVGAGLSITKPSMSILPPLPPVTKKDPPRPDLPPMAPVSPFDKKEPTPPAGPELRVT